MKTTLIAAVAALYFSPAFAGPQYIDGTGFAVSGFDVVAYFGLEQAPVGKPQPSAVPGKASITAEYNGSTFAFATEENKTAFLAEPAKYAPQFDGHCAYGVALGGKVPANPNLWRIVDGKLYLNITEDVVYLWEEDVPGHITKAGGNWDRLEGKKASRRSIPSYSSDAPVQN